MKVVEFKGKDLVAVDVDGFKVSIDRGVWTPGYGTPQK